MTSGNQERTIQAERLYKQYGKPLEPEHWGEYVAISQNGETVIGPDLNEVFDRALARFGPGSFLFKVGEVAVGKWR